MRRFHLLSLSCILIILSIVACNSNEKTSPEVSENNIDAVRNFIRAALDGKFDEARTFMLTDSVNINYMDVAERAYQKAEKTVKDGYRTSSIRIYSPVTDVNDSVSIIIYSNSFKNDPDTLKVIRVKGQWLVDLKYLYEHDADTLYKKPPQNDSLQ